MSWKKFSRTLVVMLVMSGVLAGSAATALGVLYGALWFGFPGGRFVFPAFLIALALLAKVGGRILWPSTGISDRAVPLPEPTPRQRLWRMLAGAGEWTESIIVTLSAIGCAFAVGTAAYHFGLGKWTIVALAIPAWFAGIVLAVKANVWVRRKVGRFQPPSEAETLLKTFD